MAVIDTMRINKDAMQQAISDFESRRDSLENAYLKISNEVRELDGSWHGDASEQFKDRFEELYNNLKQTEKVMTTIITDLKAAVEVYEQGEAEAETLINNAVEGMGYTANF